MSDPLGMLESTKRKRKAYDYNPREDLTFIFIDGDNPDRYQQIKELQSKLPKDINIIATNPTFELWFLNHFKRMGKPSNDKQILKELKRYIPAYEKNLDVFSLVNKHIDKAIANSLFQLSLGQDNPKTEVVRMFKENIIKPK